jgi:hypothetical protein
MKKDKSIIEWAKQKIIEDMIYFRVFGKHHWREDTVKKRFRDHNRKYAMIACKELKRKGILICKPTPHGKQWWLNLKKKAEIREIIDNEVI